MAPIGLAIPIHLSYTNTVIDQQPSYVYESPDGGETVYRRPFGGPVSSRELHRVSERRRDLHQELKQTKLWGNIHRAAQKDPVLKSMLEQIEIYYHLKDSP
jgi:hypothetical protein